MFQTAYLFRKKNYFSLLINGKNLIHCFQYMVFARSPYCYFTPSIYVMLALLLSHKPSSWLSKAFHCIIKCLTTHYQLNFWILFKRIDAKNNVSLKTNDKTFYSMINYARDCGIKTEIKTEIVKVRRCVCFTRDCIKIWVLGCQQRAKIKPMNRKASYE